MQGKAAPVPARGKDERRKEERMYSKGRREREAGTVWAVGETPEWFSMTGCRGDGREWGKGWELISLTQGFWGFGHSGTL